MAMAKLGFMMLLFISICTGGVVANTQNWKIKKWDNRLMFIDNFGFTETEGRLQLKVTNISFFNSSVTIPNPNPNPNPTHSIDNESLSNMAFFLSDKILEAGSCLLNNSHVSYELYTMDKLQPGENHFDFIFSGFNKSGEYILYFQNCALYRGKHVYVTLNAQSSMYNLGKDHTPNYLSPNKSLLTKLVYPFFSLVQFSLACLWLIHLYRLHRNRWSENKYKIFAASNTMFYIHLIFVLVPYLRAWSLIFDMFHNVYILRIGCADCWPSLLLSGASDYLSEPPIAIFLVLFSTGWSTLKPLLYLRDKMMLIFAIFAPLVLVSLEKVIQFHMPLGRVILYLYPGIISTFCLGTIGIALYRSTVKSFLKFLREIARGNSCDAASAKHTPRTLLKYATMFKSLVYTYSGYLTFQVCAMGLLEIFSSYLWLIVTLKELAAIVFYVSVACHMRPELWKLKIRKDGIDHYIKEENPFLAYDDIEKAKPLLQYDDDDLTLIYSSLDREWDEI